MNLDFIATRHIPAFVLVCWGTVIISAAIFSMVQPIVMFALSVL